MRVSQLRAHRLEEVVVCDVVYYWGLTKKPVVFLSDQGKKILLASLEATINSQADETQGEPSSRRTPARRRGNNHPWKEQSAHGRGDQTDRVFARRVDQSRNRSSRTGPSLVGRIMYTDRPAGPGEGQVGIKKPYQGHLEEGGLARARGGRDDHIGGPIWPGRAPAISA